MISTGNIAPYVTQMILIDVVIGESNAALNLGIGLGVGVEFLRDKRHSPFLEGDVYLRSIYGYAHEIGARAGVRSRLGE
jgi:hypothetical protein